ncbi:hypothetical protein FOZ63_020093, partial [Perkinsus olseni]
MRNLFWGALIAVAKSEPLSLPITKGRVPLTLDGQTLNFEVDSGVAESFAFYGPVYEQIFGKDSCGRSPYGCYFCPPEKPCDDILSRKVWQKNLYDGEMYAFVEHNMTLVVENRRIEDLQLGLVVGFPIHDHKNCSAILGLSFGGGNISETFLEQLQRQQVIDTLSYSIHAEEQGPGMSGNLSLGGSATTQASSIGFSEEPAEYGVIAVPQWPLKLFDSSGKQVKTRRLWWGKAKPALVDTGAMSLIISNKEFEKVIDTTWEMMRKQAEFVEITDKQKLLCASRSGRMVRKEALPYLPTLGYKIGDPPNTIDIRIEPKHYIHSCEALCCQLDVDPFDSGITTLGQPLFRAYDVKFDLSEKRLHLSHNHRNSTATASGQPTDIGTTMKSRRNPSVFRKMTFRRRSQVSP